MRRAAACAMCGCLMEISGITCTKCGAMSQTLSDDGSLSEDDELEQTAPPGGEGVVKALKKKRDVKNPWAVAWSMKKKGRI